MCPKYWVMMFENEEFFSAESESIDMHVFTTKIYKFVMKEGEVLTPFSPTFGDLVCSSLFTFFEEVSSQICDSYQKGREVIMAETHLLEEHIRESKIINFYFIYKLLLEVSQNCSQQITDMLSSTIFRNIEQFYSESFADYILEKHEVLSLVFGQSNSKKYSEDEPLIDIMERIKNSKSVKWRQALREDGESAIILEFDQEHQEALPETYMIKMDPQGKIRVLNCNTLRRKWVVTDAAEKKYSPLNTVTTSSTLSATKAT